MGTGSAGEKWGRGGRLLLGPAALIVVCRGAGEGPGGDVAKFCIDTSPPEDPISS